MGFLKTYVNQEKITNWYFKNRFHYTIPPRHPQSQGVILIFDLAAIKADLLLGAIELLVRIAQDNFSSRSIRGETCRPPDRIYS